MSGAPCALDAEVQRRQHHLLARARQRSGSAHSGDRRPSRWNHVPLADLVGEHNDVYARGGGFVESGHEPVHSSKSGRCLLIDTPRGRWYCRSCGQSGDAVSWVMAVADVSYAEAASSLAERYGPPVSGPVRRRTRRSSPVSWRSAL